MTWMVIWFPRERAKRWAATAVALLAGLLAVAAQADPLRVGTSGDYSPFSSGAGSPGDAEAFGRELHGFDIDLIRTFARETGRRVEFVRFRWPQLSADLADDRFDLAVSGVTVRADRSLVGRFSVPVARSGAVLLVRAGDGERAIETFDAPGVTLAVNQGGHLERVTRAHFPRASIRPIERNRDVLNELVSGRAQAVVTDTLEAPHWLGAAEGLKALGPFTRDDKAALIRADLPTLAHELDAWLLARERDGTLAQLRARHFDASSQAPTATPDAALVAASNERLALMPLVAEAKRRSGAPVEDRVREARVLASARASVGRAAKERGVPPPDAAEVTVFFQSRIEEAKRVQREVLAQPADPNRPNADLAEAIRPALIRIGDRIAMLLVAREVERREDPVDRPQRSGDQ